jgi:hypothetical protein
LATYEPTIISQHDTSFQSEILPHKLGNVWTISDSSVGKYQDCLGSGITPLTVQQPLPNLQAVADKFDAESKPCNNGEMCDVHTDFAIVQLQTAVRAGKCPDKLHCVISEKAVTVDKCTQTSDLLAEYQDKPVGPNKKVGDSKPSRLPRRKVSVHDRK